MKPFYAIDLTDNKNNEVINGREFLVATPPLAITQAYESLEEKADQMTERAKLPKYLRVIQWVCGAIATFAIGVSIEILIDGDADLSFAEIYSSVPWLFYLCGACAVVWLILFILAHKKEKSVLESDEGTQLFTSLAAAVDGVFDSLSVPDTAIDTDILCFTYKIKKGEVKPYAKGTMPTPFLNQPCRVYSDTDNLYIADIDGKYALPRRSFKNITKVKKKILLPHWNKQTDPSDEQYKQFKIARDDESGMLFVKNYCILTFNINSEEWGIYFPNYELPTFEELTGLKAE